MQNKKEETPVWRPQPCQRGKVSRAKWSKISEMAKFSRAKPIRDDLATRNLATVQYSTAAAAPPASAALVPALPSGLSIAAVALGCSRPAQSLPRRRACWAGNPAAHPDFTPPQTATIVQLQEWLDKDEARSTAQSWIDRLGSFDNKIELLDRFIQALVVFQKDQLADWNDLAAPLGGIKADINAENDRKKRQSLEKWRDRIEAELDKIAKRRLHDELVQASILPIYGFPIDVVRLLTGESNEFKSSQGKHRLERDRRLALGEYAPGQEIVVDDRVYKSVGITRPKELENKYYWVCKECNHFHFSPMQVSIEECPVCKWEPNPSHQKMKLYSTFLNYETQ